MRHVPRVQLFISCGVLMAGLLRCAEGGRGPDKDSKKNQTVRVHNNTLSSLSEVGSTGHLEAECVSPDGSNPKEHVQRINKWLKDIEAKETGGDVLVCGILENLADSLRKPDLEVDEEGENRVEWVAGMGSSWSNVFSDIDDFIQEKTKERDEALDKHANVLRSLEESKDLDKVSREDVEAAIKKVVTDEECWRYSESRPNPSRQAVRDLTNEFKTLLKEKTLQGAEFQDVFLQLHSSGKERNGYCQNLMGEVKGYIERNQPTNTRKRRLLRKRDDLEDQAKRLTNELKVCEDYQKDLVEFQSQLQTLDDIRFEAFYARDDANKELTKTDGQLSGIRGEIATNTHLLDGLKNELISIGEAVSGYELKFTQVQALYLQYDQEVIQAEKDVDEIRRKFADTNHAHDAANKVREHLLNFIQHMNLAYDQALRTPLQTGLGLSFTETRTDLIAEKFPKIHDSEHLPNFDAAARELMKLAGFCEGEGLDALKLASDVVVDEKMPCAICANPKISNHTGSMAEFGKHLEARQKTVKEQVKALMNVLDDNHGADTALEDARKQHAELPGARRFNSLWPTGPGSFYSEYLQGWMVLRGKKKGKGKRGPPQAQVLLKLYLALGERKGDLKHRTEQAENTFMSSKTQLEVTVQKQREVEVELKNNQAFQREHDEKKDKITRLLEELRVQQIAMEQAQGDAEVAFEDAKKALEKAVKDLETTHAKIFESLVELGYEGHDDILEAYHSFWAEE